MKCSSCNAVNNNNNKFCDQCGVSLQSAHVGNSTKSKKVTIKCGNCDYIGKPERNRGIVTQIFVWLSALITGFLVPILYYSSIGKWICPECGSNFIGRKDKSGKYVSTHGKTSATGILIMALFAVAVIVIIVIIIVTGKKTATDSTVDNASISQYEDKYSVDALAKTVQQLNADPALPQTIDEYTTLIRYGSEGKKMIYYLELSEDAYLPEEAKSSIVANACQDIATREMLNNGVVLEYSYSQKSKTGIIDTVTVEAANCL